MFCFASCVWGKAGISCGVGVGGTFSPLLQVPKALGQLSLRALFGLQPGRSCSALISATFQSNENILIFCTAAYALGLSEASRGLLFLSQQLLRGDELVQTLLLRDTHLVPWFPLDARSDWNCCCFSSILCAFILF